MGEGAACGIRAPARRDLDVGRCLRLRAICSGSIHHVPLVRLRPSAGRAAAHSVVVGAVVVVGRLEVVDCLPPLL